MPITEPVSLLVGDRSRGSLTEEQVAFYQDEGYLILPRLLSPADMASVRQAMSENVSEIADDLFAEGLIADKHEEEAFETRLARLFQGLTDDHFLKYGRSWRVRKPGYYDLMANPKILDVVESMIGGEIFPILSTTPARKCPASRRVPSPGIRTNLTGPAPMRIL